MNREQFYRGFCLERHDPVRNLRPADELQLSRSLIGHWDAQRCGGRVSRPGHSRAGWFATAGEAEQAAKRKLEDYRRRGYTERPRPEQNR